MSNPTVSNAVLRWLQNTWKTELLLAIQKDKLSAVEAEEAMNVLEEHRESIEAAHTVRMHGVEYAGEETLRTALQCPFITEEESLEWLFPAEQKAKQDTRWYSRKGLIYLMRNKRNGYIKIGFSKNPKHREATLQSEEPEIELIHSHNGTARDEIDLHERFDSKRLRGEWFALDESDIEAIRALSK